VRFNFPGLFTYVAASPILWIFLVDAKTMVGFLLFCAGFY
jgi:hypothetical protein